MMNVGYALLVIIVVLWSLGPIAWSVVVSITPDREMQVSPAHLWPPHPTSQNYRALLTGADEGTLFRRGVQNAASASALSVLATVPIAVLGAYALTHLRLRGAGLVKGILLATLVVPAFATIIPLYRMLGSWGLLDTLTGLVAVYASAFLPLSVWLMVTYFETLPRELWEAALVDGCDEMRTLVCVILPSSYPVLFASALIIFLSAWNQFLIPLILAPSMSTKPVAVVVSEFVTKYSMEYGLMNAGGLLAILPPAAIALVFRRFLIQGLVAGATKG